MKKIFLIVIVLTTLITIETQACMTILCEAVCAKYQPMRQTVKSGQDKFTSDYYQLVDTKAVYVDGEISFSDIFNQLKSKCSGSGESLIPSGTKTETKLKVPPSEITPSQACKRIEGASSSGGNGAADTAKMTDAAR